MLILQVAISVPLQRLFDYLPPPGCDVRALVPGLRVQVPFGARKMVGILVALTDETVVEGKKLKAVLEVLDTEPVVGPVLFQLCRFISEYYHYPLGEVFHCALPTRLCQGKKAEMQQLLFWRCTKNIDEALLRRPSKQKMLIRLLQDHPEGLSELELIEHGVARSTLTSLLKKNWVESFAKTPVEDLRHYLAGVPLGLNTDQKAAVEAIVKSFGSAKVFLLDGVTGSGKTEVYLQVIAATLAQNKQALVLVPEIGLTPQTVERFESRFQVPVVALHSHLTDQERLQGWMMARSGRAKIIIGTRSAIFIPLESLGIVVVDEEHDMSFKQQEGVRYHARDVAIIRAQIEKVPVILGSATPSLESFNNGLNGRFERLVLPVRAGAAIQPKVSLLDLRNKKLAHGFSPALIIKIKEHLEKDEQAQVLIFLNRRGYAPALMCHHCGWIAICDHCLVRMTLHQLPVQLHCHHCDSIKKVPKACPGCQQCRSFLPLGVGTEQIEEFLQKEFKHYGIVRVDRDSTRKKGSIHELLEGVHHGKHRILLGTQMIAKGHHFPNVTLVAIMDLDSGFFSTDFRALERTGQLLLQVAGRAGRAEKKGEVAIQTLQPEHPFLHQVLTEPYEKVLKTMLSERVELALPPAQHFVLFRAEAVRQTVPMDFLIGVREKAMSFNVPGVMVMQAVFAPMPKRAGRFRAQLLIMSTDRKALHQLLKALCLAIETLPNLWQVRWSIDVDPLEMM